MHFSVGTLGQTFNNVVKWTDWKVKLTDAFDERNSGEHWAFHSHTLNICFYTKIRCYFIVINIAQIKVTRVKQSMWKKPKLHNLISLFYWFIYLFSLCRCSSSSVWASRPPLRENSSMWRTDAEKLPSICKYCASTRKSKVHLEMPYYKCLNAFCCWQRWRSSQFCKPDNTVPKELTEI